MSQISEEYHAFDRSPVALRRFGFTVGTALVIVGVLLAWRGRTAGWPLAVAGGAIVLLALVVPGALKILHRFWMSLALAMGWVMTNVILTIVFFLVVTPIGLLQRLFGKSALALSFRSGAESYWEIRERWQPDPSEYERQF